MNKGRVIIFSVGGVVVLLGLIGIIALLSGNSEKKEEATTPILNSKEELTYKDMIEINGTNTNEYTQNHSQKDSMNDIKNQISSVYGIGQNQNNSGGSVTETNYQTPVSNTYRQGNYKGKEYEYLYDQPKSGYSTASSVKSQPEQKPETSKSWVNPQYLVNGGNNNSKSTTNKKVDKVYKGVISGSRDKYITKENNRVSIRVMEAFTVNGVEVPKNMQLVAYANFNEKLTLTINSIHLNGQVIPVNIRVLDSQGQDALEMIGKTGEDISEEVGEEAKQQIKTGNKTVDKGISILSKKRKVKARVSGDSVLLKIEN